MKKLVLGWMIIILMIFSVFSLLLFFGHGGITGAVTVDGNNGFVVSAEVSSCGTVSSDITFSEDVNAAGDCFNIVADNVVINGAGYSLYGNGSGIAFIFGDYENLTISNFTYIIGFTKGSFGTNFSELGVLNINVYNVSEGDEAFV